MSDQDRTGQLWTDLDLGELVTIYVYGEPVVDSYGDTKHPVVVVDQARHALWSAHPWEQDSCMRRLL